jgi:hypothetical protein
MRKSLFFILLILALSGCQHVKQSIYSLHTKIKTVFHRQPNHMSLAHLAREKDQLVIVNKSEGLQGRLLVLKNITDRPILLTRNIKHQGASAGWSTTLKGGRYSALQVNSRRFVLMCAHPESLTASHTNCAKVLSTYWLPVKVHHKNDLASGSFWVSENQILANLYHKVLARGYTIMQDKG